MHISEMFLFVDDLGATKLQMGWTVTIGRRKLCKCSVSRDCLKGWIWLLVTCIVSERSK
jgi:hypothetical protein